MTTGYKVTELFCIIDEFCKHFNEENAGNLLEDNSGVKRRRRQASLSDSEIMTILLYFHFGTFRNFKHYYLFFIKGTMKSYFPKAVSYNRFVELESRVFFQLMFFLNLGAFGRCTGITFVDSTMIPVCHNLRRYTNKVFKGIATDGKGAMGWCHGFKLHLACNDRGEIIALTNRYFIPNWGNFFILVCFLSECKQTSIHANCQDWFVVDAFPTNKMKAAIGILPLAASNCYLRGVL